MRIAFNSSKMLSRIHRNLLHKSMKYFTALGLLYFLLFGILIQQVRHLQLRTKISHPNLKRSKKSSTPITKVFPQDLRIGRQIPLNRDRVYSPVVIEKYKLIFFPIAKVGCTSFLMLARRMAGFSNYKELFLNGTSIVHNKQKSGLLYMYDYSQEKQKEFLTSDEWVKAVFIRDPKERFLSAWLNKAVRYPYASEICCPRETRNNCTNYTRASFQNFLHLASQCIDPHWMPQTEIIGAKYLPYINFVGRLENVQQDSERFLKKIGAWESCGKQGWGLEGNAPFAQSKMKGQHAATEASKKIDQYYTPDLETKVEKMYECDYSNNIFRLTSQ